jgi:hypothetical protein
MAINKWVGTAVAILGVLAACNDKPRQAGGFSIVIEVVNPGTVEIEDAHLEETLAPCVNENEGVHTCTYEPVHCYVGESITQCFEDSFRMTALGGADWIWDHWETIQGSALICDEPPSDPLQDFGFPDEGAVIRCRAIFVRKPAAALVSIEVSPASASIASGLTQQFTATGTYDDNSTIVLTEEAQWSFLYAGPVPAPVPGPASVSNSAGTRGLVTTAEPGSGTITATVGSITSAPATITVTDAVVQSISISPDPAPAVPAGRDQPFTATATLTDGTVLDITEDATWSTSNSAVATVSNAAGGRGLVTAVDPGDVTITADLSGVIDDVMVSVVSPIIDSIEISPRDVSLPDGGFTSFTALGNFSDGSSSDVTNLVSWTSSDTTIATIGSTGIATTVGNTAIGPTVITATKDGVMDTTTLTVTPAELQSITVSPDNASFPIGRSQAFTALGTYSDGGTVDVTMTATWTAEPGARVTITSAGLASAPPTATAGPCTVTATIGAVNDPTSCTVTPAVAESIAIVPEAPDVWLGATIALSVDTTYSDGLTLGGAPGPIQWTIIDPSVATIDADGLCTPVAVGTSMVTATCCGGLTDSTQLTVNPAGWVLRGDPIAGGLSTYIASFLAGRTRVTGHDAAGGVIDTFDDSTGTPLLSRIALGNGDPQAGARELGDGSLLVGGRSLSSFRGWLSHIGTNGSYDWQITFDNTQRIEAFTMLDPSTVLASYRDLATGQPGLLRVSTAGTVLSAHSTDLPTNRQITVLTPAVGGGVFAAATDTVFRLNTSDAIVFQKTLPGVSVRRMAATSDGGIVVVGTYTSGTTSGYVAKLDSTGMVVFQQLLGTAGALTLSGIVATSTGYVVTGGLTGTGAVAIVLDGTGTPTAARQYADTGGVSLSFMGVAQDTDGTFALGARGGSDRFVGLRVAPDLSVGGCADATLGAVVDPSTIPATAGTVAASDSAFAFPPLGTLPTTTATTFTATGTSEPSTDACTN